MESGLLLYYDALYSSHVRDFNGDDAGDDKWIEPVANGLANPHGTAMNNTLQQVSGAIGSALLLTIMTKRMESSGVKLAADAAASGTKPANAEELAAMKLELTNQAMLNGINYAFLVSTIIAVVALILSFFMKRVTPPKYDGPQAEEVEPDVK